MGAAIPKNTNHPALNEPEIVLVNCDPDMKLGTSDACAILGISSEMIKHYKNKGWLAPVSGGGKGQHCQWRLGDVVAARRKAIEEKKYASTKGAECRWEGHVKTEKPCRKVQSGRMQSIDRQQKTAEVALMSSSSSRPFARAAQHRSLNDQYRLGDAETRRLIRLMSRTLGG